MDKKIYALALILALAHFAYSEDMCDFASGLPAEIYISPGAFNSSPATIEGTIVIENTGSQNELIRLLRIEGNSCYEEKTLGVLQAGSKEAIAVSFDAKYSGEKTNTVHYAVVATGAGLPEGKYFDVQEDWTLYEKGLHEVLNSLTVVLVPSIAIILIILVIVLAEWAYSTHTQGDFANEYTMKTLFFPMLKNRPFSEMVADVMLSPFFWVVEALAIGAMAGIIWNSTAQRLGEVSTQVILLSLAGALFLPIVYFAVVWYFNEIFEKKPMRFFVAAFFWGMVAALLSLFVNSYGLLYIKGLGIFDAMLLGFITTAALAPVSEEIIKGIGILGLFGHHEFNDTLNGLLMGFSVGLGFSFIENWFYFASKVNPIDMGLVPWGFLVLYRTFFNSVAHGCFSAALAGALGWAKTQKLGRFTPLVFLPGLQLAIALHVIFNITAILDSFVAVGQEIPVFVFNPTLVLTLLGLMFVVFAIAVLHARARITRGRPFELMLKGLEGQR
jgi:protease PrsW